MTSTSPGDEEVEVESAVSSVANGGRKIRE